MSDASSPGERTKLVSAWAEGALFGCAAALLAVVPAALRTAAEGASLGTAWLALAGSAALVLVPLSGALRAARPFPSRIRALPVGLLVALGPLCVLGRMLVTHTHHRPLGAATFAVLGAATCLGAVAVAARLLATARDSASALGRVLARAALAAAGLLSLALAARPLVAALASGGIASGILDAGLCLALAAGGVLVEVPATLERRARLAGPLLAAVLVAAAFVVLRSTPPLFAAARAVAPLVVGPAAAFVGN